MRWCVLQQLSFDPPTLTSTAAPAKQTSLWPFIQTVAIVLQSLVYVFTSSITRSNNAQKAQAPTDW